MPSLALRTEPSVRQTSAILGRVERELSERGALVDRAGVGGLRFRMPRPWAAPRLGVLLVITSGQVALRAGAGERWKVRYELSFAVLRGIALVLTVAAVAFGWTWPRTALVNTLVAIWALVYGVPYYLAGRQFKRIVEAAAREVVERRRAPRADGTIEPVTGEGPTVDGSVPGAPRPPDAGGA